ncbi:hypothetical protein U1Q18_009820 [Sarracenia purpurea var. burkii]
MASSKECENFVYLAKLTEQAECYDEMVDSMKKVTSLDVELTVEERNLLSVGYKNVVGARRASWRILSSIEQKEESRGNDLNAKRIGEYKHKVESKLTNFCNDIMTVIDEHLIPPCTSGESTVFYYKMKGDYYQYLTEFKAGNDRKEVADHSMKEYQAATTTAEAELPPTHPIRLGLALNFSVLSIVALVSSIAHKTFDKNPKRGLLQQKLPGTVSGKTNLNQVSFFDSNVSLPNVAQDVSTKYCLVDVSANGGFQTGAQCRDGANSQEVGKGKYPPFEKTVMCPGQSSHSAGIDLAEAEINILVGEGKQASVDKLLEDSVQSSFAVLAEVNPIEDEIQEEAAVFENPYDHDVPHTTMAEELSHSLEPQDPDPKSPVHNIDSVEDFPALEASHSGMSGSPSFKVPPDKDQNSSKKKKKR